MLKALLGLALGLTPELLHAGFIRPLPRLGRQNSPVSSLRSNRGSLPALNTRTLTLSPLPALSLPPLSPQPSDAGKPALHNPGWTDAGRVAEALARERGVPEKGYVLFRENIARYIYNAYPDETLKDLSAREATISRALLPPAARWLDKLDRDLAEPYSDDDVLAHLDRLQAELAVAVALMREMRPEGGFTLTLMGGLMRGRFSARSDLDVILRSPDQDFFERMMKHPFGYLIKERFVILSPPPHNKRVRRALGPMQDIGDGAEALTRPRFLNGLYAEKRREFAERPVEREIPPEKLAVMMELKKLSKKALRYPPNDSRRVEIEERMRRLSKQLWES